MPETVTACRSLCWGP